MTEQGRATSRGMCKMSWRPGILLYPPQGLVRLGANRRDEGGFSGDLSDVIVPQALQCQLHLPLAQLRLPGFML